MSRLKLVPWEPTWLAHPTLDLHAIYRRPQRDPDTWEILRDNDGFVIWDLTTPQSIRNHTRMLRKGFEYVTLATADDVIQAASPALAERGATPLGSEPREPGEHPDWYLRQPGIRGPWSATVYLEDLREEHAERRLRVEANVQRFGADGAEEFERQTDPDYRIPARYRQPPPEPEKRRPGRPRKTPVAA